MGHEFGSGNESHNKKSGGTMTPETEEILTAIERLNAIEAQSRSSATAMSYAGNNYNIGNTILALCEVLLDRLDPKRKPDFSIIPISKPER